MMGDTLTVVFTWAKVDGHKTEPQVTESSGEVVSPQCARKESGSRVSRPQCPSVCHQFTLLLGHMSNDHLNSSVVYKTYVNSSHKISTLSGCEPVLPSSATDSSCEGISCKTMPEIADFTSPSWSTQYTGHFPSLTLHTDAHLPWYGNALLTSVPLCHCRLAFRRACRGTHELVPHEATGLFNSCLRNRLRHQVCPGSHSCQPSSWRTGLTWKPPVSRGFACQHASLCPVPCD